MPRPPQLVLDTRELGGVLGVHISESSRGGDGPNGQLVVLGRESAACWDLYLPAPPDGSAMVLGDEEDEGSLRARALELLCGDYEW